MMHCLYKLKILFHSVRLVKEHAEGFILLACKKVALCHSHGSTDAIFSCRGMELTLSYEAQVLDSTFHVMLTQECIQRVMQILGAFIQTDAQLHL